MDAGHARPPGMAIFSLPKETMSDPIARLSTEQRNPRTTEMDLLSPVELVQTLHAENFVPAEAVRAALPEIARAVEMLEERLGRGGRLFYVGAGTSGRIGVLDASECPPTFGVPPEMVQGIIAGGDWALRHSVEGAEDDREAGGRDLRERGLNAADVVVAIAASGRTPYAIGALEAARQAGAYAIALVNVDNAEMAAYADLTIAAVTGPEPLTGSTRLKAGTAQKMVLNLLSTAVMVRLGKTYGNLMVDVQASNAKLRERAIRIVCEAAGADRDTAQHALGAADWHAKTAIVALIAGVSAQEARERLAASGGRVRAAVAGREASGP